MAVLLSEKKSFPFMYRGTAADCMTASNGWWITNDNTANVPADSYKFGTLVVFSYSDFFVRIWVNNNGVRKIYSSAVGHTKGWQDF